MSLVEISDKERRLADRVDTAVMNALAVSESASGVQFANALQVMDFSKTMALAHVGVRKHLRGNPGACLAICVQAIEWGMSPFAVANKSYNVNDQIAFESQLIQAVILRRAPIKGRIKFEFTGEGQKRVCRAWARLKDEDEIVEYVSPQFGDITPKNSPLWKADPDQQHAYYSGRALCRRHFSDVLLGVYDRDELEGAPALGPDHARDVTPARSLSDRLTALAESAKEPNTPSEVTTGASSREAENTRDPPPPTADAAAAQQDAGASSPVAPASDEDVFPGDRLQQLDALTIARDRGAEAYRKGMARKAVPVEFRERSREAEAKAWGEGHDAARAAEDRGDER